MKRLSLIICSLLFVVSASAQTPSGSDYLVARPVPAKTLFYDYSGAGTLMPKIKWGLDEAWCSEPNMLQGRNYLNLFKTNVSLVRLSFQPTWGLTNSNGLSTNHMTDLNERLRVLALLGNKPEIFLNCDPKDAMNSYYQGTSNSYVTRWVNLIKATGQHIENQGYTVTGIAPFNEPDLRSTKYPPTSTAISDANYRTNNSKMQSDIAAALKSDSWGSSKKMLGGNVLNPDYALTYYTNYKANFDEGNEHQLAGTAANFIGFMTQVKNDGKLLCQDEMHNVMEAMVGANHGMNDGIWWGTSEHARSQFCRANDGTGYRLAYHEDTGTFTAASIYRNTQDGVTEAYLGCSERQARETSYGFVSKDRDVYYDGYGPTRAFYMHLPADPNGSYQSTAQKNAERVINIQSGEDVQPFPTVGDFQIMNASTGKVIQGPASWTGWSANQATLATGSGADGQGWRIDAVAEDIGGDFSYYTIHSYNGQWWDYYLDDNEWGFEEANPIIMYPGGGSGCEQWYFVYAGDGNFYIHNRYSNLCLDLNGDNLVQRTRTNSATQKWKLVPATISPDLTAPAAPTGLTATSLLAAVQLSWNAVADTDLRGYTIMRTVKNTNDWNTIARNVTGTTYIDNTVVQGTEYTYKIKAIDLSCNLSAYSSSVNGKATYTQGLIARWDFEGTPEDKTANKMGCALTGGTYSADFKTGAASLSFNGSSTYALLPYSVSNHAALTFCGWVYWNGGNAWQRIFDFGNGEDAYLFLSPSNGSNMVFEIKANGTTQNLTATKLSTGAWKHVAVTVAKNNVKIYVDGTQVGSSTTITLTPSDIAGVCNYLGRSQFAADPLFNGTLDDVRIYNYALSQSEIRSIINSAGAEEPSTEWEPDGSYYIYNVEAGMFLNQGNAYGTQASLSSEGLLWKVYNGASTGLYRLQRNGASDYLFADNLGQMYVDGNSNHDFQMVRDSETGITTISVNPSGTYGTAAYGTSYVGWAGDLGNTTVSPVLKSTDHSQPGGLSWIFMNAPLYNQYQSTLAASLSARQALWPYLQSALANGMDCSSTLEVYQDLGATATELTNAKNALAEQLATYVAAYASSNTPMDITYLIDHAGCGSETFAGWTPTGTWATNTTGYRNGDAVLTGRFTESWVAGGGSLEDRTLTQVLPGLPAGNYQLAADVVATQQANGGLTITGVSLMLDDEFVSCSTANGVPQCFTTPVQYIAEGSTPTIRFKVASTNANWVAFDNFRLFYLGNVLPGDVDRDGDLDEVDVQWIALHLVGKDPDPQLFNRKAADVNGDGHITIADITALVNKLH